jgi:hypothetical protein
MDLHFSKLLREIKKIRTCCHIDGISVIKVKAINKTFIYKNLHENTLRSEIKELRYNRDSRLHRFMFN